MINFSGVLRRALPRLGLFLAGFVVACGGAPRAGGDREALESDDRLWVLAPHPDDEVLMAGEQLRAAIARHRPVSVLVMTNGDLSCERNGHARQAETVAALAALGVPESEVHFLGYPDGYLDSLGPQPLDPLPRAEADGTCGTGDHTYASRGAGAIDVHSQVLGAPGAYVASNPEVDLALLLARERPTEIVTAHGIDRHPDHAMTYVYLRRALERAAIPPPRILRSVVHQGACWPNGAGEEPCPDVRTTQGTPFPAFAPPLAGYVPTLRIASTDGGEAKRAAIAHYTTQLLVPVVDADESWLSSFARTDEVFWPETLAPDPDHEGWLVRAPGTEPSVSLEAGESVHVGTDLDLVVDASGVSLVSAGTTLRQLPVPHGEDPSAPHEYDVRVDPRPDDGPVSEVTVRRDGVFWMLAVVPR